FYLSPLPPLYPRPFPTRRSSDLSDLADEFDQRIALDQRAHHRIPVGPVLRIDLGRHLQRLVQLGGELDGPFRPLLGRDAAEEGEDRKSTRLNSSHVKISYAVFCL